jgi:nitroimidazol reductase NimA-like FMN-containing flavoprotein (pyridoxamine 5'-phosphate oxidase superfamily)
MNEIQTDASGDREELTVSQCWELLREGVVGRLGVVHDRRPDIFPVNFAVDHGTIVFRTGSGTLFQSADGAFVAFEVDGYDAARAVAWSVVVRGVAHEVYQLDDALAALRLPLYPWHEGPKPRIMRIHAEVVTGRRFVVRGGHRVAPGKPAPGVADAP